MITGRSLSRAAAHTTHRHLSYYSNVLHEAGFPPLTSLP